MPGGVPGSMDRSSHSPAPSLWRRTRPQVPANVPPMQVPGWRMRFTTNNDDDNDDDDDDDDDQCKHTQEMLCPRQRHSAGRVEIKASPKYPWQSASTPEATNNCHVKSEAPHLPCGGETPSASLSQWLHTAPNPEGPRSSCGGEGRDRQHSKGVEALHSHCPQQTSRNWHCNQGTLPGLKYNYFLSRYLEAYHG